MTERLYHAEPYRFSFDARLLSRAATGRGWEVVLDRTAFYPGGGGQPADRGTLAGRAVIALEERGDDVVHVLDGEPTAGPDGVTVHGELDAARRLDFMAQHTGQHLLSQCLLEAGGLATVSVHFGDEITTIEVAAQSVGDDVLAEAERRANAVVRENRKVVTRELDREEALRLPLRRRPPEGERLRIVEIEGSDWAACGGVHVASTGAIALVKVTGVERIRGRVRVHALMGDRAVADYGAKLALVRDLGRLLTCGERDIARRVGDLVESERAIARELRQVRVAQAAAAAADAVAAGKALPPGPAAAPRLFVARSFEGLGEEPVKAFVDAVLAAPGRVVVAIDRTGAGFRWTVAHSVGADLDLPALAKPLLASLGLRGGGRGALLQGAGGDATAADAFVEALERALRG
jgi:alanyl-tRNA synthetase